jgi:hypothetical protein
MKPLAGRHYRLGGNRSLTQKPHSGSRKIRQAFQRRFRGIFVAGETRRQEAHLIMHPVTGGRCSMTRAENPGDVPSKQGALQFILGLLHLRRVRPLQKSRAKNVRRLDWWPTSPGYL